jgi:hypothetical protein
LRPISGGPLNQRLGLDSPDDPIGISAHQYLDSQGNLRWTDTNHLVSQHPNRTRYQDNNGTWRWTDTDERVAFADTDAPSSKEADGWLVDAAIAKVPERWLPGAPIKNGIGTRWTDPENPGNGIRIDRGDSAHSQITQQTDHVVIRYGGKVIGRDGQPIDGSIKENYENSHIPLSEWLAWENWYAP